MPSGNRRKIQWTQEERDQGQVAHADHARSPICWRGIWDTGVNPELKSELEEVIYKDRKDDCFFIEYSDAMLFSTAEELHRIRYENRNLKRSLVIAIWGLYISAAAVTCPPKTGPDNMLV